MSEMTAEQADWVKAALGFDIAAALRAENGGEQGKEPAQDHASGPGEDDEKFSLSDLKFWKKKEQPKAEDESARTPPPKNPDLAKALQSIAGEVAALKKLGFDTKQIEGEAKSLGTAATKAETIEAESARTKAVDGLKTRAAEVLSH
ncbi:MAG: hypothetical protein JOZ05_06855, partial [Acetobacteraceae bacterium]|nr:hypothetical protein [Acetobacteraceae bacterium]